MANPTSDGRVDCGYCRHQASLVIGKVIYPHRRDLWQKQFYHCAPCKAWVGCHPGTTQPLGRLANAELRQAKQTVHALFDPFWLNWPRDQGGRRAGRHKAYARLAKALGIEAADCHVEMFDLETCQRAAAVVRTWGTLND